MKKYLFHILACNLIIFGCGEPSVQNSMNVQWDEPIDLKINDADYVTFFVCDKVDLNKLKKDLSEFGQHIDYSDTLSVSIYSNNNFWIVSFPKKFTVGQAAFMASWIPYGFCVSKNIEKPNKDIFFYTDDSISSQDFIAAIFRDGSSPFKVNVVSSSFEGVNRTSFKHSKDAKRVQELIEAIPTSFKLNNLTPVESNFILQKFEGFQPFIDSSKKDNSVVI